MTRTSIRDMLYEAPGPKAQRRIRLFTVLALLLLAAFLAVIIRQFAVTGQFAENPTEESSLFTYSSSKQSVGRIVPKRAMMTSSATRMLITASILVENLCLFIWKTPLS